MLIPARGEQFSRAAATLVALIVLGLLAGCKSVGPD